MRWDSVLHAHQFTGLNYQKEKTHRQLTAQDSKKTIILHQTDFFNVFALTSSFTSTTTEYKLEQKMIRYAGP